MSKPDTKRQIVRICLILAPTLRKRSLKSFSRGLRGVLKLVKGAEYSIVYISYNNNKNL